MPSALTKKKRPVGKGRSIKLVQPAGKNPAESRKEWLRRLRAEYTPAVSRQTLLVNEDFSVYGES